MLDKENFNVEVNIEDRPIYANVDTEALQRILKNLIDNAIKYGSDGRFLGISLYEKEKHVFIDIEDKGSGISETEKSIFSQELILLTEKRQWFRFGYFSRACKLYGRFNLCK